MNYFEFELWGMRVIEEVEVCILDFFCIQSRQNPYVWGKLKLQQKEKPWHYPWVLESCVVSTYCLYKVDNKVKNTWYERTWN